MSNVYDGDPGQVYGKAGFDIQLFAGFSDDVGDGGANTEPAPVDPSGTEPPDQFAQMVSEFADEDGQPLDGSQLPAEVRAGIQKVLEKASPYRKLAKKLNISDPTQLERMVEGYHTFNNMSAEEVLSRLAKVMGPQMAVQYIARTYGLQTGAPGVAGQAGAGEPKPEGPLDYTQVVEQALGENAEYLDDITKKSLAATMKAVVDLSEKRLLSLFEEKYGQNLNQMNEFVRTSRRDQYMSSVRNSAEKILTANKDKVPNTLTADVVTEMAIRIGANPRDQKQMELAVLAALGAQSNSVLDATFNLVNTTKTNQTQEKVLQNLQNTSGNILRSGAPAQQVTPNAKKSWRTIADELTTELEQQHSRS